MGNQVLYDELAYEDKKHCCFMERVSRITLPWDQEPVPSEADPATVGIGAVRQCSVRAVSLQRSFASGLAISHWPADSPGVASRGTKNETECHIGLLSAASCGLSKGYSGLGYICFGII